MENNKDLSFDALIRFLEWAADKGLLKKATANARKAACNQVLDVLDKEEKKDVSSIKIDTVFERYTNLSGHNLSPPSLRAYRSRLEKAIESFLAYKKDPTSWKPPARTGTRTKKIVKFGSTPEAEKTLDEFRLNLDNQMESEKHDERLVYPFPLRSGVTVRIVGLPTDLKVGEAKRLGTFLLTLAEDFNPDE